MSQYNRTNFEALYGTSGSQFPTNTTGAIQELTMRTFGKDISESFLSNVNDLQKKVTATGTNTYAVTGLITAYADGYAVIVKFTNASSGVSTLNVNTVGAKKIFINPTTQATTGHITANQTYLLVYDSALDSATGGFALIGGSSSGSQTLQQVLTAGSTLTDDNTILPDGDVTRDFKLGTALLKFKDFEIWADLTHIHFDPVTGEAFIGNTNKLRLSGGGNELTIAASGNVIEDTNSGRGLGDFADYSTTKTDFDYATKKMLNDGLASVATTEATIIKLYTHQNFF